MFTKLQVGKKLTLLTVDIRILRLFKMSKPGVVILQFPTDSESEGEENVGPPRKKSKATVIDWVQNKTIKSKDEAVVAVGEEWKIGYTNDS